jgi:hypothetical protein
MATKLSLRPSKRSHSEPAYADPRHRVVQHQVEGLPEGQKAIIGGSDGKWKILRTKDGATADWVGDYSTADEALNALEQEIEKEGIGAGGGI